MPEPAPTDLPDAEVLAELATDLLLADAPEAPDAPFAIAITDGSLFDPLGLSAPVLPLPTAGGPGTPDAVSMLCHVRPDADWVAMGVVVDGWTVPKEVAGAVDWRYGSQEVPPSRHPARQRVRTFFVVSRSGAAAVGLLRDGGDVPEVHAADDASVDGPTGPLPDALHRVFGLRTPPCRVPVIEMWASLWLGTVAALASRKADWATVARLHPAAFCVDELDMRLTPENLVLAGRALARGQGWDQLQLEAVTNPGSLDILPPPDVAAWADAGMFARLVLREVAPLWATYPTVERILSRRVLIHIEDVLDEWGLDVVPPSERAA